ncbi:MAG TPA: NADH-quinone oxidoreductase subunit G [Segeticoccus sp.]|uniref:NADH-quinone oxidoreductase subunit G n=1 Tax=Segeticoccus sp. TaxID=2706531 RepID=UPI002D7FD71C|nr:NADH-quinone oxidoreductase subunit G [Segeticoccus sp.]HET8600865.1 NADH-quinone oxidoreductase subunit G [Segeticoccus sp.]
MTVPTSPAGGGNAVTKGGDAQPPAEPKPELISLTVDGIEVSVPKGALVIRAAEQVGVQIPRFCDHPLLDPVGACRQCLVEVSAPRGGTLTPFPKPQASCTLEATEGMVVKTQHTSPVADKAQHGQMEFLLINHPLDCPVCDKGGECPLQNQAMSNGRPVSRFEDVKRTYPKPINISSQVLLDRERCILCARCTRFSDQIAGDPFIALIERGALQQVGIYEEKPFESYFSGNTVQICPVGALTGSAYRFRSRPFDLVSTPSVCEHCASGCAIRTDHRRGVVMRRMALEDREVNEEWNCDKGRWAFTYAQNDRITDPLVRDADGAWRVASWNEALDVAAHGLAEARDGLGVGVLVGGRVGNEDAYAYSKLARTALGTNDIDFRARPHSPEEADFLAAHVAATSREVTYADLEKAQTVLLVAFEPEEESPIVFLRLRKANRKHKTAIWSVAPFATRSLEKMAGSLISAAPGTEAEVLQALADGKQEVAAAAEALRDADQAAVILVGERLAGVPGGLSAAARLAKATGAKLAWVPRRAGERGALEAGALPNLLPGGRPVADAAARAELAAIWGVGELPAAPGRDTSAMVAAAAEGELSGLLVGGVDPDDLPDPARAREALRRAFVVSLDLRVSPVMEYADVVLPVAAHQEKSGAFVDWEGRVRPFDRAINSNTMSDYRVLDLLAAELGEFLGTRTVEQTRQEMAQVGPWRGERAAMAPVAGIPALPSPAEGEAVLATWPHLLDSGLMQAGEPFLAGTAPRPLARLSATTAKELGIAEGEVVVVSTDTGSIALPVAVTTMPDHVVWLPTNSPGSAARAMLGAGAGDLVQLSKGGAA